MSPSGRCGVYCIGHASHPSTRLQLCLAHHHLLPRGVENCSLPCSLLQTLSKEFKDLDAKGHNTKLHGSLHADQIGPNTAICLFREHLVAMHKVRRRL